MAGPEGALALAGVMGGASSEVSDETRVVALEAAYWEPLAIRRAAKALGMHTEASHRFERGADPEAHGGGRRRASRTCSRRSAPAPARPGLIDRVAAPAQRRPLALRPSRIAARPGRARCRRRRRRHPVRPRLRRAAGTRAKSLAVEVPTWRGDVAREVDLVEEVGRHFGLDKVPLVDPAHRRAGEPRARRQAEERAVRRTLVAAGLTEAIGYTFVREGDTGGARGGARVALENPLAEEQAVLRNSLVVPGLLDALDTNLRQGRRDVALFEIGRVFQPGPGPICRSRSAAWPSCSPADSGGGHWSEKPRPADFFDLKGLVELLFERLGHGARASAARTRPCRRRPCLPASRAERRPPPRRKAARLAGRVAPGLPRGSRTRCSWPSLASTLSSDSARRSCVSAPLPRFPAVDRDLSVLSDARTPAAEVEERIRRGGGSAPGGGAVVRDRYDRPPVPAGKVSLTLSLRYQHPERTLTGDEVQASVAGVIRDLRAAGLEIRGE